LANYSTAFSKLGTSRELAKNCSEMVTKSTKNAENQTKTGIFEHFTRFPFADWFPLEILVSNLKTSGFKKRHCFGLKTG